MRAVHLHILLCRISEHWFFIRRRNAERFPFVILAAELLQRNHPKQFQYLLRDAAFSPKGKFRSRKALLRQRIRSCFLPFRYICNFRYHRNRFSRRNFYFRLVRYPQAHISVNNSQYFHKVFRLFTIQPV